MDDDLYQSVHFLTRKGPTKFEAHCVKTRNVKRAWLRSFSCFLNSLINRQTGLWSRR